MNIYEKLQKMRVDLQNMNVKKTGENKFAGYKYYELGDILPPINKLMLDNKVTAIVSFPDDYASLTLVNAEQPEERLIFHSPMAGATLKGAHDIQNLGAVETYQRRYLYMTAFEVVESDFFDATQGKPKQEQPKASKSKLSGVMRTQLNEAVMNYGNLAGVETGVVMDDIQRAIGKTPAQMDDKDGDAALSLIQQWTDKLLNELGA